MKSIVTIAFTMTLALSAGSAFADDCSRPPSPAIPSGAAANQETMIAAQAAVKKFLADSEAFRNCLQAQEALVPKEQLTADLQKSYVERYNAAVDAEVATGNEFNQAIRDYKAARTQ